MCVAQAAAPGLENYLDGVLEAICGFIQGFAAGILEDPIFASLPE